MTRVNQQPAFVLKTLAYKETSFISQVFSKEHGVLSVISKGPRAKNSKNGSTFKPFRPLLLCWQGKSELKTLTQAEALGGHISLQGDALYCGFYLNELILNFLHEHDPHPVLFEAFSETMDYLAHTKAIEACLRQFEKVLLEEIGYGLGLESDAKTGKKIEVDKYYSYVIGAGAVEAQELTAAVNNAPIYKGQTLINLNLNCLTEKSELREAKALMRRLIDHQLDGKILKSRELFI
ncbi:MAG: hypothetical protein A6F71_04010 [Cycloclasticus sp. symbiont of Poecilosclerida sp. M]|nr:MAG: hypothetical protein A6F71_04010 [Cycloclasticus sp. symbiont of Poecilosclerida sp. M]